jgi:hypothetical protein
MDENPYKSPETRAERRPLQVERWLIVFLILGMLAMAADSLIQQILPPRPWQFWSDKTWLFFGSLVGIYLGFEYLIRRRRRTN